MKMEPNNIEQDFKQKLEQRTIQPTEMAWDRLDAMLSITEEKKSKKPNRTWMYMSASFLALLLVGVLFLNQEKQNTTNGVNTKGNSVVTIQSSPTPSEAESDAPVTSPQPVTATQEAVATANTTKPLNNKTQPVKRTSNATIIQARGYTNDEQVAVNNENTVATVTAKPGKIKVDANELLASVDRNSANAPKQQLNSAKIKQDGVKVNPNSLLTSVEGELNQSFRDKVLETVSKNYNTVKSSLATRNHQ